MIEQSSFASSNLMNEYHKLKGGADINSLFPPNSPGLADSSSFRLCLFISILIKAFPPKKTIQAPFTIQYISMVRKKSVVVT